MKKKVWLVSELFYPETVSTGYIMTEIAVHLANEYEVNVICGPEFYEKKEETKKSIPPQGVSIYRIKSKGYNKNSFLSRSIGHISVSLKMFFLMKRNIKNGEQILLVTNPVFVTLLMRFISNKRNWKIKLFIHDVFPENLIISGIIKSNKSFTYRSLSHLFNKSLEKMDKIIACGRDMKELFVYKTKSKKEVLVIENWADDVNIAISERNKGKTNFLFAGNLGRLQGLDELFNVVKKFGIDRCDFTFIGNGAMQDYMIDFVKNHNLDNVHLLGWLPREEQNTFLAKATVGLITLKEGMYGLGVPSKLYNLLAAGKPVFYIGDVNSEIHRVLKDHKIGWFAESGNEKMIIQVINEIINTDYKILEAYSKNARNLAEGIYSKETILKKTAKLFKN
jgi:glycosyltransferase involved in cell wall biosynthesis